MNKSTVIESITINSMNTCDITMKIEGMRKFQEFSTYPIGKDSSKEKIIIQSETRIGKFNIETGIGKMSKSYSAGAFFHHLQFGEMIDFEFNAEDLLKIQREIQKSGTKTTTNNKNAGFITCDNSGASRII